MFNKDIPMAVLRHLSSQRSEQFYVRYPALCDAEFRENYCETGIVDEARGCDIRPALNPRLQRLASHPCRSTGVSEAALSVLRVWLSQPEPFLIQSEKFAKAGIASGSKQKSIKMELLRQNLIREHKIQVGKGHVIVWEPTEEAYRVAGLSKPQFHSKGGWLHQWAVHHIRKWALANSYQATIEFLLDSGKAVDLVLTKGDGTLFIEVAISHPFSKELVNLRKDLRTGLKPSELIFAVQDSRSRAMLQNLIEQDLVPTPVIPKISVRLIGEFLELSKRGHNDSHSE